MRRAGEVPAATVGGRSWQPMSSVPSRRTRPIGSIQTLTPDASQGLNMRLGRINARADIVVTGSQCSIALARQQRE
jgi:hypothetical protein